MAGLQDVGGVKLLCAKVEAGSVKALREAMDSIAKAAACVDRVDSPYLRVYGDIANTANAMGKPLYKLEDGKLVLTNCPVANNAWYRVWALNADRFLSHWSRAYQMVRDTVIHFVISRDKLIGKTPPLAVMNEAERMGEAIIDEMAAQCASHKVRFLLVTRVGRLAIHCMTAAPPTLPGMSQSVSSPDSPALAAARQRSRSRAPVPAESRFPSTVRLVSRRRVQTKRCSAS